MKDLNKHGKEIKSELKAGGQDDRGNVPNKPIGNAGYNPQKPLDKTTQQPLPGKGQNIGGTQGGFGGAVNKDKGTNTGSVDFNKNKGGSSWK